MSERKLNSYRFGIFAELIVIIYFFLSFHRILAWRYRNSAGEIDIIAKRGRKIVFIEVKARRDRSVSEVVTSSQMSRMGNAAKLFIGKNKNYSEYDCRFDLIIFNSPLAFKHIKNCWEVT